MKATTKASQRVTAAELSRLSGYSKSSVTNFVRDGLLQKGSDGKFDCVHSLKQIQRHEVARQHDGKRPVDAELAALRASLLKTRIARLQLEIDIASGKMHPEKDCVATFGILLSTVWQEICTLPHRIQAAHPEIHGLANTVTDIVNNSADRIVEFAKQHGAKLE